MGGFMSQACTPLRNIPSLELGPMATPHCKGGWETSLNSVPKRKKRTGLSGDRSLYHIAIVDNDQTTNFYGFHFK